MARRQMSEGDRAELARRQAALTALTKHPSWPELEAEVDRKQARLEKYIVSKLLVGRGPIDEAEVNFTRGFLAGMRWFTAVPTNAESALERFLQEQEAKRTEESEWPTRVT